MLSGEDECAGSLCVCFSRRLSAQSSFLWVLSFFRLVTDSVLSLGQYGTQMAVLWSSPAWRRSSSVSLTSAPIPPLIASPFLKPLIPTLSPRLQSIQNAFSRGQTQTSNQPNEQILRQDSLNWVWVEFHFDLRPGRDRAIQQRVSYTVFQSRVAVFSWSVSLSFVFTCCSLNIFKDCCFYSHEGQFYDYSLLHLHYTITFVGASSLYFLLYRLN